MNLLKKFNLKALEKEYVHAHSVISKSIYVLKGINETCVKNAEKLINDYLDSQIPIPISKNSIIYLKQQKNYLQSFRTEYGVFLKLEDDKVFVKGNSSKTGPVKGILKELDEKITKRKLEFSRFETSISNLKNLKNELIESFDVAIIYKEVNNNIIVYVYTDNDTQAKIVDEFNNLKPKTDEWKPQDYNSLKIKILKERKLDIKEFKKQWNLTNFKVDDTDKNVKLASVNVEDLDGAKQALVAFEAGHKIVSYDYMVDSVHFRILSHKNPIFFI